MKKMYLNIVFLFSSVLILFSCNKNNDNSNCISYVQVPVINIAGADTVQVNQEVNLDISFNVTNGCGQFNNINEINSGNQTTINVIAKYEGCLCTQIFPTLHTFYKFKKSQPGIYELKFQQSDTSFLTHTILVQ